ncbi:MAG: hypothetical protein ACT4QE_00970 [Anaerolineales bacterium]
MKRFHWFPMAAALTTSLATLACATVTNFGRPTATPIPVATRAPSEQSAAAAEPLILEGGPTIGTPREARIAISESALALQQLAQEDYTSEELNAVGETLEYTIELTDTQPLLWSYGWCATTREILLDNLEKMEIEFSVNGTPVDVSQFNVVDYQTAEWQCRDFTAVIYDWPGSGEVEIETRITYTEAINDGQFDFPVGEKRLVYRVTVP